jgi:N-formylglutamate deformylase
VINWLDLHQGDAPLVVAFPHGGEDLVGFDERFASPWLARRDADWWITQLYDFAHEMGATTIATRVSRSIIDVNRPPDGSSLYPGQATTELCPTTTFDGEPLYAGTPPTPAEIARRRVIWHTPYHAVLAQEMERLRAAHGRVVLFDAHSIRSRIPRLFAGRLPTLNLGTNDGTTCAPALQEALTAVCADSGYSHVVNGRFKGGWTTRHYGRPQEGFHAVQLELAIRAYMPEPENPSQVNWPTPFAPLFAAPVRRVLADLLAACLAFAKGQS